VHARVLRVDIPILMAATAASAWALADGGLGRVGGAVMVLAFGIYTVLCVVLARREARSVVDPFTTDVTSGRQPRFPPPRRRMVAGARRRARCPSHIPGWPDRPS
jgi:Ca2+/Na+ antiporter